MPVSRSEGRTMTIEIPPRSGAAFTLRCGEILQIIDPKGGQVSDMVAFMADDPREALSNGRTFDYEETIRLTAGHRLWRSEEHTSELQSLMRISYAVFCLKKNNKDNNTS